MWVSPMKLVAEHVCLAGPVCSLAGELKEALLHHVPSLLISIPLEQQMADWQGSRTRRAGSGWDSFVKVVNSISRWVFTSVSAPQMSARARVKPCLGYCFCRFC